MFAPSGASGEARIGDPIGVAYKVGETLELVLAAHLDDEPAVATGEPVEHHLQALAGLGALAHAPVVHHDVGKRNHCVEHRDVYVLADAGVVAMTQRSEHADDPKQCSADVAERAHGAHRWGLTGLTFPFVESAHCFGHTCVCGPAVVWGLDGVAEATNRQVHGGRVNGANVVVAKSHAGQGAALEVFGDDIEAGSQRQDQVAARRVLEVDTDRLLREVVAQKGGANIATLRVFHCRQRAATQVAAGWMLHLDDRCAESAEQLRCIGEGLHLLEGKDAHAIEWLAVCECFDIADVAKVHGATVSGGAVCRCCQRPPETSTNAPVV